MSKGIKAPKQGQVFKIKVNDIDENNHVISGEHFCIVITPDSLNNILNTASAVFVTSKERKGWGWRVPFKLTQGNPDITSYAITEQIMTFDRKVFSKPIGFIRSTDLQNILLNIQEIFKTK